MSEAVKEADVPAKHTVQQTAEWLLAKAKALREEAARLEVLSYNVASVLGGPTGPQGLVNEAAVAKPENGSNGNGSSQVDGSTRQAIRATLGNRMLRPKQIADAIGMSVDVVQSTLNRYPNTFKRTGPGWYGLKS